MDRCVGKKYIVVCLFVLFSYVTFAGNDEELFLRGNKLYEQGDYDKSLDSYQAMQQKGRAVLYNIGNCYYNKGDYAQAIVYWSRAEHQASAQEKAIIIENKQQAFKKIGITPAQRWYDSLLLFFPFAISYFSLFSLQLLFLLCWYLLVLIAYKNYRYKKIMLSVLCAVIALFALLLGTYYIKSCTLLGVVVDKRTSIFVGPDKGFPETGFLEIGNHVVLKEQREGWYKVQYSDKIGWVKAEAVQII